MPVVFIGKTTTKYVCLFHLVIKVPENSGYKPFRVEQAPNKLPMLFLYVEMLVKKFEQRFYTL